MPRRPSPWYWEARKAWFVKIDGKRYRLADTKDAAFGEYHRLMAGRELPSRRVPGALSVALLFERFLDWCQRHREPGTYQQYQQFIQSFIDFLPDPAGMAVPDLKPFHVVEWIDSQMGWNPTTKRNGITHVTRAFNWAAKLGYIHGNPIHGVEKPAAKRREEVVTQQEFDAILSITKDQEFRDLLNFCWETGCRPQEAFIVDASMYDADGERLVIPKEKAKGKKRARRIYLSAVAKEIVERRIKEWVDGPMFRNRKKQPWDKHSCGCRFDRIKTKLHKRYCLYQFRHTWATRKLEDGWDHLTVAEAMGHANGYQLAVTYQHLNRADAHLRRMVNGS